MQLPILLLLLGIPISGSTQELPPILSYTPDAYQAGNQNWMLSQGPQRHLFAANNDGLLEFDGARWRLHRSPNETIFRSVYVDGARIYTGCYMEFGYWLKTPEGSLDYHSLSDSIPDQLVSDEQFWNILPYRQYILFQSLQQLFLYDTTTLQTRRLLAQPKLTHLFSVADRLLYYAEEQGVFEIIDGQPHLALGQDQLGASQVVHIFQRAGELLLLTDDSGILEWEVDRVRPWKHDAADFLRQITTFSGLQLRDGSFAIGTISNGLILLDANGRLRYHIQQEDGLSNNTVLSIQEDVAGNIWLGLDNGIDCINLAAPFRAFEDQGGRLGTIYAAALYQGKLYLGTNQGLFSKAYPSTDSFRIVPGTDGQVWSLRVYDGQLFCGHHEGTFLIENDRARLLSKQSGTWDIQPLPHRPDYILQGHYEGFSLLKKLAGTWRYAHPIEGFDYSAKQFEITEEGQLFTNHEYRGIFRMQLDSSLRNVHHVQRFNPSKSGKHSGLAQLTGAMVYANQEGFFRYDQAENAFIPDSLLNELMEPERYASGRMLADSSGNIWLFSRHHLNGIHAGRVNNRPDVQRIPLPYERINPMQGYECFYPLGNHKYLIGSTEGYIILDRAHMRYPKEAVQLSQVRVQRKGAAEHPVALHTSGAFNHRSNHVEFRYAVAEFGRFLPILFQYRLEGYYDEWSNWSAKAEARFENLPPGTYSFSVRARVGEQEAGPVASYSFTIRPPWYLSRVALVVYLLLLAASALAVHILYRRYYHQQRRRLLLDNQRKLRAQQLEAQQAIMELKNEQLQQDVANKNRELAVSTMSLVKKNELLIELRKHIANLKFGRKSDRSSSQLGDVLQTIDQSIDEEDTWQSFKTAFEHVDNQFFRKLKSRHPELTPSELKLCAYLRLNLSSKEIAPLMNISTRSVEIKRYRLRKKMGLPHRTNLVNYILEI